jgi:hypothetical protein
MAEDEAPVTETSAPVETQISGEETGSGGSWPADVQAEFTKKTQALSDERKSWEAEKSAWNQQRTQAAQQLQQYAQQLEQQQQAGRQSSSQNTRQNQRESLMQQLQQMSYLDGPTAATLVQRIMDEGINPLNNAIKQRDQALSHIYKEYKTLKENVGNQTSKQAEVELASRISKAREDAGLPDEPWVNNLMEDVYYSHEGPGLTDQFPKMVQERWAAIQKGVRDADRLAAKEAKQSPFPTKGGEMSPTSGKTGGYKTPQERTDELWPMLNPGQTE